MVRYLRLRKTQNRNHSNEYLKMYFMRYLNTFKLALLIKVHVELHVLLYIMSPFSMYQKMTWWKNNDYKNEVHILIYSRKQIGSAISANTDIYCLKITHFILIELCSYALEWHIIVMITESYLQHKFNIIKQVRMIYICFSKNTYKEKVFGNNSHD